MTERCEPWCPSFFYWPEKAMILNKCPICGCAWDDKGQWYALMGEFIAENYRVKEESVE